MEILVGSTNPVKIKAVKKVFATVFDSVVVKGVAVESGVSDQPWGWEEGFKGAKQRAENCFKKKSKIDFGVGLEGTMIDYSFGTTTTGIAVVIDKKRKMGIGTSGQLFLPENIVSEVKKGVELGKVLENFSQIKNIKQKEGAFGYFTKGLISRNKGYQQAVIFALAKFLKK